MLEAMLNGQRVRATPKMKGALCPLCQTEMIAKCGTKIVHHWAHKKGIPCDPWHEPDSEWRLQWLKEFKDCKIEPVIEINTTKHFADVCSPNGGLIIFRRSLPHPDELRTMEEFFHGLVWIFDMSNNKRTARKLWEAFKSNSIKLVRNNIYVTAPGTLGNAIPREWERFEYPIIFDFSNLDDSFYSGWTNSKKDYLDDYWCLLPYAKNSCVYDRILLRYKKKNLLELLEKRAALSRLDMLKQVLELNKKLDLNKPKVSSL